MDLRIQQNPGGPAPIVSPQPGINIPVVTLADPAGNAVSEAQAGQSGSPTFVTGSAVGTSQAAGSSAVSNGTTIDLGAVRAWPCAAVTLAGAATGGTVQLQGSLDGTNFYNIGAAASPTAAGTTVLTAAANAVVPARFVRLAITVAFVGTTITAVVGGA